MTQQPDSDSDAELAAARARIDALDADLQKLIVERAKIAQRICRIKEDASTTGDHYRPAREAQVLKKAMIRNQELDSPLPDVVMARLVREIMSACLALESPLSVACLGPEGTYTQAATWKHFGHGVEVRPEATIEDVFRTVEAGSAGYGVVPVENSTEGVVNNTLDRLASTSLNICGEVWLPIHHQLLSHCAAVQDIQTVYSHRQSLAQCRAWLDAHAPQATRGPVSSNGAAARYVADHPDEACAAIASTAAGEIYGLPTLAANIEDDPNNTTRFAVIGRRQNRPSGQDKTSIVLQARKNEPGALFRFLQPLAEEGVDMMRIESRPSRQGLWNYNFFIDMSGHHQDANLQRVLEKIQAQAIFFRILGSYPKAVL